MYQVRLTYCSIDKGYNVYLTENGIDIRQKFFKTEPEARLFIEHVKTSSVHS